MAGETQGGLSLVHHNLRLGLVGGLVVAHLHIFIALTCLILIQLIVIIVTLLLKILTLAVGDILFLALVTSGSLTALHFVVISLVLALVGLLEFLDERGLEFTLLGPVGVAVIVQVVRLRLVRGVLGGCRLLRIP